MDGSVYRDENDGNVEKLFRFLLFEDVLDMIFAKMSLKDLCRAAAVCTLWRRIAKKELLKRNDIRDLILPIVDETNYRNECDYNAEKIIYLQEWHVSDSLKSLPELLLIFQDGTHRSFRDPGQEFYSQYKKQLSHLSTRVIAFETIGLFSNNTEIHGVTSLGLGIALPKTSAIKINYFSPSLYYDNHPGKINETTVSQLLDEAFNSLSIDVDEHNCVIFFESKDSEPIDSYFARNKSFTDGFLKRLKTRCKSGTYSLFGGCMANIIIGRKDWADWFALKICGPAIKSWSIVLSEKLTRSEIENKLLQFKKNIKFRTNSIALAMVHSNIGE